ncbi:uncharacterized protein LOC118421156 [Branchiostoma floridae]|uniref:Uncharacterized protein LOC118421156 n=1 Tax=Branchiostoma floridae TaxID=7739 RepID=A0A9J7MZE2_BRAFL|nr:uncharacterized protein LOC118421156 [Branchiostoma floridae]
MYGRTVLGQKLGVTPDKEAAELFSILKNQGEPVWSEDDYYYYLRPFGSDVDDLKDGWEDFGGAVLIFATNEKVHNYYKFAEGDVKSQMRLPKCLRGREITWRKPVVSRNVGVGRKSCRQNFCNEPHHCPTYKLMDTLGSGAEKRRYRVLPSVYNFAPTCHLGHSAPLSQPVLYDYLRAMGVWPHEGFQMFDQNMMTIYQNETGPDHCQKKFRSFAVVPVETPYETASGAKYKLPQQYPNRARRVNYWRPTYYVKCFGGNGDGEDIFDMAEKLASELDDMGVCRRRDHFHVSQYNRQSRLLDRHNEIWFWDDKCRSLKDNAPNITFEYSPVTEDRHAPDIGDRCTKHDCPEFQKVTTFDGFVEKFSPAKSWRLETDESHVHKEGRPPCYFPFIVDGEIFHNCTYHKSHRPWCAWNAVFAAGYWSYCDEDDEGVRRFDGVITMTNMTYSRDLNDSSSTAFKELATRLETELTKTFSKSLEDFHKLTVTAFIDDEINVGFHLTTMGQTNVSQIDEPIKESFSIEQDTEGSITFDPTSLHFKENDVFQGFKQERICTFPFTYKGEEYNQCVTSESGRPWCAWDAVADEERTTFCDQDDKFVCTTVTSCGYQSAKGKGISRLLSYFNGNNNGEVVMDTARPVLVESHISTVASSSCSKKFEVCLYLPRTHQANPPLPNDDKLTFRRPLRGYSYSMPFGKLQNPGEFRRTMNYFVERLELSKQYGVHFDKSRVVILNFDSGENDRQYNELLFFKTDSQQGDRISEVRKPPNDYPPKTCDDSECVLFKSQVDHGEFMEIQLQTTNWVCASARKCPGSAITPIRKMAYNLFKYYKGENERGENLGDMGKPFYGFQLLKPRSSNEPSKDHCTTDYACVPLSRNWTDIPKPTNDNMYVYTTEDKYQTFYVNFVRGPIKGLSAHQKLAKHLEEGGKAFEKLGPVYFSYDDMGTPNGDRTTYVAYRKKKEDN